MSLANSKQFGGNHYKTGSLEHWDVIERYGVGYLEGCATKYLTRLDKKGTPVLDAEKPAHYVEKLIEMYETFGRGPRGHVPAPVIGEFLLANGVTGVRAAAIVLLLSRWTVETLRVAADLIDAVLIEVREQVEADDLVKAQAKAAESGAVILPWPGKALSPSFVVVDDPHAAPLHGGAVATVLAQSASEAGEDAVVVAVRQERGKLPLPAKDTHACRFEDDGTGRLTAKAVPIKPATPLKEPKFPATLGVDDYHKLRPALREFYRYEAGAGEYVLKQAYSDVA